MKNIDNLRANEGPNARSNQAAGEEKERFREWAARGHNNVDVDSQTKDGGSANKSEGEAATTATQSEAPHDDAPGTTAGTRATIHEDHKL